MKSPWKPKRAGLESFQMSECMEIMGVAHAESMEVPHTHTLELGPGTLKDWLSFEKQAWEQQRPSSHLFI